MQNELYQQHQMLNQEDYDVDQLLENLDVEGAVGDEGAAGAAGAAERGGERRVAFSPSTIGGTNRRERAMTRLRNLE